MSSTFLTDSAKALRSLRRAQQVRERTEAHAQVRFDRSRAEYRTTLSEAALAESRAWRSLPRRAGHDGRRGRGAVRRKSRHRQPTGEAGARCRLTVVRAQRAC